MILSMIFEYGNIRYRLDGWTIDWNDWNALLVALISWNGKWINNRLSPVKNLNLIADKSDVSLNAWNHWSAIGNLIASKTNWFAD